MDISSIRVKVYKTILYSTIKRFIVDFIESYRRAGKIACSVRELAKNKDYIGTTLYEICEQIENRYEKMVDLRLFP